MVAHLGLRTHKSLYKEIGNIIAKLEKAECYEEAANNSQRIFTLIKTILFGCFLHF